MNLITEILRLTKRLYPRGRAFHIPVNSDFEKLHRGLAVSEKNLFEFNRGTLDSILPDNANFDEDDATAWERRLGMITNTDVDLEDRKAAILRKMAHPGTIPARQHYLYVQGQLQAAGFDVWVYENRFFEGGNWITKNALLVLNEMHLAVYGVPLYGGAMYGAVWGPKIVNSLEADTDAVFTVGPSKRSTFFIGGFGLSNFASVPPERETEFRDLVLRLKPAHSVAYIFINYNQGIFDNLLKSYAPPGFYTGVFVVGNRAFILRTTDQVEVWDIFNDVQVGAETFGAGTINDGQRMTFNNDRCYISDVIGAGTSFIRVFNYTTGAAVPAEDFDAVMTLPQQIALDPDNDFAYVVDKTDEFIYVFNISDGADRTADFGFGNGDLTAPIGIAIREGKAYVTSDAEGISVFDIATATLLETFGSSVLSSPENIQIFNNRIYVVNRGGNNIRVFDLNTYDHLSSEDFGAAAPDGFNGAIDIFVKNDEAFVVGNNMNLLLRYNQST